jgi:hypothetical protein
VLLHFFGKALVPKADGLVASVLDLLGDGATRRVGGHNHDDLFLLSIGVDAAGVTGMFEGRHGFLLVGCSCCRWWKSDKDCFMSSRRKGWKKFFNCGEVGNDLVPEGFGTL